jgi:ParB/RepB/Spo0J family partition protein
MINVPIKSLVYGGAIDSRAKASRGVDIDSLANSIRHLGLILPLAVVQEGDKYRVVDGNRRLEALKLINKGKKDVEVPVLVQDADTPTARAMSLAANIERLPLHHVDQYEAFAALAADGKPLAEIAATFGIGERAVEQRMALGALAPLVRQLYREDKIDHRMARLLTRVPPDRQVELMQSGQPAWQIQQQILAELEESTISATSSLAEFVGREAYLEAGGELVRDLFAEEGKEKWSNPDIALGLANARTKELREQALADGWSFFETVNDWVGQDFSTEEEAGGFDEEEERRLRGRLEEIDRDTFDENDEGDYSEAQKQEIHQLEAALYALQDRLFYTDEQKARTGVVLDVHYKLHHGCTRRRGAKAAAVETVKEEAAQSSAVMMELDAYLTRAVHGALVDDPSTAVSLLILTFLSDYFLFEKLPNLYGGVGIRADFSGKVLPAYDYGFDAVEAIVKACGLLNAKTFDTKMKAVNKIEPTDRGIILSYIIARSIQTRHRGHDLVLYLDKLGTLDIRRHFTPTVDNFFSRLSKRQLQLVLKDAGIADDIGDLKKAEAATHVAKALPADWVPEAIRPKKLTKD